MGIEEQSRSDTEIYLDGFSENRLAKACLRWSWDHKAGDLRSDEQTAAKKLACRVNRALD